MKALKTHKLRLPSAETATICRVAPPAMADASPVRTTLRADLSINETPHQRNEQDDERTDLSGKQTRKQKVRWRVPPASARAVTRHRTPGYTKNDSSLLSKGKESKNSNPVNDQD
ncbi:unnamed protein product [Brassica napus]|uniref:(rape) hypothetical protein n=1 Tax=Brassica napus TaxID=3708 RepID=A0A817AKS5_BRANA|nr:unnamed protein product [Brassica napus]